jgi:RNA polymerase sigma-70 factor, ECF subfamily
LEKEHLKTLYEEQFAPLMRYSFSIVKNQMDAADIVQLAFMNIWQKRHELEIHSSEKSYLYKTVYHESLKFRQKAEARAKREQQVGFSRTHSPFVDSASHKELERVISEAIKELPTECRRIFELSRNENLRYREIALKLNLSQKTVENQIGKALKLLRAALKDYPLGLLFIIYLYHG